MQNFSYAARPEILAPAGDMPSALAALAAGADAVYLGLKHFSARMQAENFSSAALASLIDLAHNQNRKIYVAMNTFFKPGEEDSVARLIKRMLLGPHPDAIIAQDLAIANLAGQAGFTGEIHFSTLANCTHQSAMYTAKKLGASRIILPRELSVDEIRAMDAARPEGLALEVFVHGALCYCVSGRCWWSSYMGGKSGLRGRCVQPCRRVYKQGGREGRFFSSLDLSLDVLAKTLLDIPGIRAWKIEGRKKGPHYVYYVTTAYKMLRENDPALRREAVGLLEMALSRSVTHAGFLPQRAKSITVFGHGSAEGAGSPQTDAGRKEPLRTSSGLLCGKIIPGSSPQSFILKTRMALLPQDRLRIGREDEPWHQTLPVSRSIPKGGSLTLKLPKHKTPKLNTPVFLIDRREPELLQILETWRGKLDKRGPVLKSDHNLMKFIPAPPKKTSTSARKLDITLRGSIPAGREGKLGIRPGSVQGLWLSPKALNEISRTLFDRISWWLPPVIWPDEEEHCLRNVREAMRNGARHFVCNAPWQEAFFPDKKGLSLTAGPCCNITNIYALEALARLGFNQAIVSPELGEEDYLALPAPSPLPLGMVISGFWPVGISRHNAEPLKQNEIFSSPKREGFWLRQYGQNNWIYPAWPLDLTDQRGRLEKAGYSIFITLDERPPKELGANPRTGGFNWKIGVL